MAGPEVRKITVCVSSTRLFNLEHSTSHLLLSAITLITSSPDVNLLEKKTRTPWLRSSLSSLLTLSYKIPLTFYAPASKRPSLPFTWVHTGNSWPPLSYLSHFPLIVGPQLSPLFVLGPRLAGWPRPCNPPTKFYPSLKKPKQQIPELNISSLAIRAETASCWVHEHTRTHPVEESFSEGRKTSRKVLESIMTAWDEYCFLPGRVLTHQEGPRRALFPNSPLPKEEYFSSTGFQEGYGHIKTGKDKSFF